MSLYEYLTANGDSINTLVRSGLISPKYLLWRDMYEYVHSQTHRKKKFRRPLADIMRDASQIFGTSTDTVYRAVNTMKQRINYEPTKSKSSNRNRSN